MIISKRKRRFIALTLLIGLFGCVFIIHNVLPYGIVSRQSAPIKTTPVDYNLNAERTQFMTRDSLQLQGYWIYPIATKPKAIMLLHHGIGGGKEHFYEVAKNLFPGVVETSG